MIIKELSKEELEIASQLYSECFHKEYQNIEIPTTGVVLGMYIEQELIGIAQINYMSLIFENKKVGYINSFCIKEKYRHQGYGNLLLKRCIQEIKKQGGNRVQLTSNKNRVYAHMLYAKNGFEPIDTVVLAKDI